MPIEKKIIALVIFGILISMLALFLPEQEAIAFEYVVNNTDLYDTGERISSHNYTANDSAIQLFLIFHVIGTGAALNVDTNLSINGTIVEDMDYRTTAGAGIHEHFSLTAHIPKNAIYNVTNSSNIETIEWREYPILSGRNGTLSVNMTGGAGTGSQNLSQVLTQGNNAGTNEINMNNNTIQNVFGLTRFGTKETIYLDGTAAEPELNIDIANSTYAMDININANLFGAYLSNTFFEMNGDKEIFEIGDNLKMNGNITGCLNCDQNLSQVLAQGNDANSQNIVNATNISMNGALCIYGNNTSCEFTDALNLPFLINKSINNGVISKIATQMEISGSSRAPISFAYGMHLTTKVAPANVSIYAPAWGVGFYSNAKCDTAFGDFGNCAAGYLARLTKNGTGNVTTGYGIYIENQTVGITNYGIYSAGSNPSYIEGNLTLNSLNGIGNAYACIDTNGKLYRGNPGC